MYLTNQTYDYVENNAFSERMNSPRMYVTLYIFVNKLNCSPVERYRHALSVVSTQRCSTKYVAVTKYTQTHHTV